MSCTKEKERKDVAWSRHVHLYLQSVILGNGMEMDWSLHIILKSDTMDTHMCTDLNSVDCDMYTAGVI